MKELYIRLLIVLIAMLGVAACGELKELTGTNDAGGDASNCECSSEDGPCCDGCNYYEANEDQNCEVYDYDCSDTICGADTQKRTGEGKCQGGTSDCTGNVRWSDWVTDVICSSSQLCETDKETYATCITCEHGCADGACYPDCNPADNCCESDGTTCDHGCDGTDCWPQCNPLTEPCCGSNGAWLSNTWTDSSNNLCWQDPPAASTMNWFVAAGVYNDTYNDTTEDYCGDLGSGWRLPTISELRSLVRSGTDTGCEVIEWDVSWSSVPAGYCRVWDSCLSSSDCYEYAECVPSACGTLEGPGAGGCYWDAALSGACWRYWSASDEADYVPHVLIWFVGFDNGAVSWNVNDTYYNVRCVRSGL